MKYRTEKMNLKLYLFKYLMPNLIYTLYIYCILGIINLHKLPIRLKRHAALRLIQRFDMSIEELRHILKTGKQIKIPDKKGDIGIIERRIGKNKIRIKFKIEKNKLWIITVEGGLKK